MLFRTKTRYEKLEEAMILDRSNVEDGQGDEP
jgi:hypothetical protein